ncbi:Predicted arabinose efflux permease, MFS family [Modicisalibacter ilicicola DSM 19980]|uniref:Predicted arabinose efflux permease, MFS family n=1 Tax=Modicisalibacter ilicicola DSM 19980 TaxID=1121942 RepID=A0A1M4W0A4_9GAMM|nr:MFS transporter [Halomonas ilicicola]SHE74678.1 Predicted arabinose efflux permease, MFS family [Halomonas ilicicola DSM 19980]
MGATSSRADGASRLVFAGVAFAFLLVMLGATLPTPLFPVYQQRFGFTQLIITVIFAAYAVGVIGALIVTGRWSDQLGRRPLLFGGLVAAALSDVMFLVSDGLAGLLVARVLSGISAGIYTGTATVAVIELAPKPWKRMATFIATAVNMGGLGLGPVVAGLLGQYAPWPLHLAYAVHLGLLAIAVGAIGIAPETVQRPDRPRLTLQRLRVPAEVRGLFLPAAVAGFAGFAVLGFFSATAPAFMGEVLGHANLALIGVVAGTAFFSSTLGQLAQGRFAERKRLPLGCGVIIVGILLVGIGIGVVSLWLFLGGAIIAGLGHGIAFRAGLGAVTAASPVNQRGALTSTFFVVVYVALSIPVLGIGLTARIAGLPVAGMGFATFVALLAAVALVSLLRYRARATPDPSSQPSFRES